MCRVTLGATGVVAVVVVDRSESSGRALSTGSRAILVASRCGDGSRLIDFTVVSQPGRSIGGTLLVWYENSLPGG